MTTEYQRRLTTGPARQIEPERPADDVTLGDLFALMAIAPHTSMTMNTLRPIRLCDAMEIRLHGIPHDKWDDVVVMLSDQGGGFPDGHNLRSLTERDFTLRAEVDRQDGRRILLTVFVARQ